MKSFQLEQIMSSKIYGHFQEMHKGRLQKQKTSYRVTSSLLPFTPARPNLIVTSLKSDKVVFHGPPLRPPERVTIPVTLGGISGTLRTKIKSICSLTARSKNNYE